MTFGISDLAFHIPAPSMDLEELVRHRVTQGGDQARLENALAWTGQQRIRIPDWYEDPVTMLAEATRRLIQRGSVPPQSIRHYLSATETAQDCAKPLSAWARGLVGGERIGPAAVTYEVKHACAGGTYAILSVLNALRAEHASVRSTAEVGIVGMSDVANYPAGSTAELTRGAGAVAVLLTPQPALLEIDSGLVGVWGEDVDDFFRNPRSPHPTVRGRYSVDCYLRSLERAYLNFKERALACGAMTRPHGGHFLDNFDYVVLHAPFHSMPMKAMEDLLMRIRGMNTDEAQAEMARLHIRESVAGIRQTGNLYTGSLYLCLADLLVKEESRLRAAIEGRRVLMASYGSGNTMVVFSARVVPGAGSVIRGLGVSDAVEKEARHLPAEAADQLIGMDRNDPAAHRALLDQRAHEIPAGRYYLRGIREDGYRDYAER